MSSSELKRLHENAAVAACRMNLAGQLIYNTLAKMPYEDRIKYATDLNLALTTLDGTKSLLPKCGEVLGE